MRRVLPRRTTRLWTVHQVRLSASCMTLEIQPFVAALAPYDPDAKVPLPSDNAPAYAAAGPSQVPQMRPPMVYNYVNPHTGEVVVSLLPPHHPQMICLQEGGHEPKARYGILGV